MGKLDAEDEDPASELRKRQSRKLAIRDVMIENNFEKMDRINEKLRDDMKHIDMLMSELKDLQSDLGRQLKNEFMSNDLDLNYL